MNRFKSEFGSLNRERGAKLNPISQLRKGNMAPQYARTLAQMARRVKIYCELAELANLCGETRPEPASRRLALIAVNAVQAAPVGLALSTTTSAAVVGAAAAALTSSTAAKTPVMTTLQKTFIAPALAAAIGVGTYQARQVSLLRAAG